jgi:hypothetical protein
VKSHRHGPSHDWKVRKEGKEGGREGRRGGGEGEREGRRGREGGREGGRAGGREGVLGKNGTQGFVGPLNFSRQGIHCQELPCVRARIDS